MKSRSSVLLLVFLLLCLHAGADAADPDFGPNVRIFDPSSTNAQNEVNAIFAKQEANQFGSERYAILFKPGKYDLHIPVGFYTQVAGLGQSPDDVSITGTLEVKARWMNGNATCNFWRSAENFAVTPTVDHNTMVWAVSQGVAFRHIHVRGNLSLFDGGWSSGGFLADCKIDGRVIPGSQQQWLARNDEWKQWDGGVWNMVFVGVNKPPAGNWPEKPFTIADKAPVIREKPYLAVSGGQFVVMVPALGKATTGTSWTAPGEVLPIASFYIAHDKDTAATINAALDAGKSLVLTPGIYHLDAAIKVTKPNTVVLGLGYPTLNAEKGTPAITIADVDGVKVAGIMLDAGPSESPTLLQVGEPGSKASHASDPTFLYDIFARAGGATAGQTACFVTINSSDVVGDNFWLWRADHGAGAAWGSTKNRNGLIVNGKDVTLYGLFVEHTQEYQTLWNADGGRVYFYQSEIPYDVPDQQAWSHNGQKGYASYKVADNVKTHEAWGLGIYSYFTASAVVLDNSIEAPAVPGIKFHHMVTVRLGGKEGSGIGHILNGQGGAVIGNKFMKEQLD
jgi:hypothetical protein